MPISQGNRSFKIKIKELRSKINEVKKAEEEAIAELKGDLSLQENDTNATIATNNKIELVKKESSEKIAQLKMKSITIMNALESQKRSISGKET
ncbi:MAG: hypothetical protein V8R15_04175 [Bacilli bacterium]